MTEAVVSGVVKAILENLSKEVVQEFGIACGLKKGLENLESTLMMIQAVLQDVEDQQVQSEELRNWLRKLDDVAHDADDIIDEFATKGLQQRVDTGSNAVRMVRNFFSHSNPCFFYHKIKEIGEKLAMVTNERSFHLDRVADRQHETGQRLQIDSLVMDLEIYGRVKEKEKIVDLMLTDTSDKMDISVIPIVGIGGLGKTTLAQLVYNDERVVNHFEHRMWECASDLTKLNHLQLILNKKLFLLVLDDVQNEDRNVWDSLRNSLGCGGKGSTIIVTTRIEKAAWIMGTLPVQNLSYLSEDDSWSLFKHWAFGVEREENEKLTVIGKEIVNKCRGIPLAVRTLGCVMRFKNDENEWLFVKNSEIWDLEQDPNGILPALRLSFKHLPSHLKRCFTYCCLFPKDFEIEKEEIISQWMANGFVLSNQRKEPEDVGHEYFNELLWRLFFQDVQKDKDGNIIKCKMHDLIHDLARSVAKDEYAIMETYKVENVSRRTRHVCCNVLETVNESQTLRTFLLSSHRDCTEKIFGSLLRFSCLRVLNLHKHSIRELPHSISNLIHLRYLNLSSTGIKTLPESIGGLKNLQTLNLKSTWLSNLPKELKNMCSLRYLGIHGLKITKMPKRIGKLIHLQTLPFFIVGKKKGRRIGELKDVNLRGELEIYNLELVRNEADAEEANLRSKKNLHTLILSWEKCDTSSKTNEEVFEGLQPHPNIKRLDINGFGGIRLPTWLNDSKFSNLVKILVHSCRRCEHLPSLGLLPSLENLEIHDMDALKYIGRDFYGEDSNMKRFPSLKELQFWDMNNLEEWLGVDGTDIFPCLTKLVVVQCPKLRTLPYFPSLKHLEVKFCSSVVLMSVANLTSLSDLCLQSVHDLVVFPEGMFSLTLLNSLDIVNCDALRAVSEGLDNLTALKKLNFRGCEVLESLPKSLRKLSLLEELTFFFCESLISLPEEMIGGLTGLQYLHIHYCRELMSLPDSLQSLPSLRSIDIRDCPKMDIPAYLRHLIEDYLGVFSASTMKRCFKLSFDLSDSRKITGVKINMLELRRSAEDSPESSQQS